MWRTASPRDRGATSQANLTASPTYDSTSVTAWAQTGIGEWDSAAAILVLASPETLQWWRIDLVDAANPDGYIEVGRVYVSGEVAFARGFSFGSGFHWTTPSITYRTPGGNAWIDDRAGWRVFSGTFRSITEAEARDTLASLQRARAGRRDVLVLVDPESSYLMEESIYGVITDTRSISKEAPGIYQARMRVEEIR